MQCPKEGAKIVNNQITCLFRQEKTKGDVKMPENWKEELDKRIADFAAKTKKETGQIESALIEVVGEPSEEALATLSDATFATDDDIKVALTSLKIPSAVFKKNVGILRGPKPEAPVVTAAEQPNVGAALSILPDVPEGQGLLDLLKVGGELKTVDKVDVISAASAALAYRKGVFDLPDKIADAMERFAETAEEPCSAEFYQILKVINQRNYAEIASALGVERVGQLMSKKRKDELLRKLEANFWDAIYGFYTQLSGWYDSWVKTGMNPGLLAVAFAGAAGGAPVGGLSAAMLQPPDSSVLRDAAESAINTINKIFAGTGKMVARGLAYDVQKIKEVIENPDLPKALGETTKDLMLKRLGVTVTSDYVRLDRNIAKYTLAIIEYQKITSGQEEQAYLTAMYLLGNSIPWDTLTGGGAASRNNDPFGKKGNVRV